MPELTFTFIIIMSNTKFLSQAEYSICLLCVLTCVYYLHCAEFAKITLKTCKNLRNLAKVPKLLHLFGLIFATILDSCGTIR